MDNKVDSRRVAVRLLRAVEGFGNSLMSKTTITPAERRHLIKIRCLGLTEEQKRKGFICHRATMRNAN